MKPESILPLILALLVSAAFPLPVKSEEPSESFLKALLEKGFFEVADDYLDRIESRPGVEIRFKRRIPYERGLLRLAQSRVERDPKYRVRLLHESIAELEVFLTSRPLGIHFVKAHNHIGKQVWTNFYARRLLARQVHEPIWIHVMTYSLVPVALFSGGRLFFSVTAFF
jgi:hypothetical protein